jgi:hypothetical protein
LDVEDVVREMEANQSEAKSSPWDWGQDDDRFGGGDELDVEHLSPAEVQVLESENATLINRLHSMRDDVRQIEVRDVLR